MLKRVLVRGLLFLLSFGLGIGVLVYLLDKESLAGVGDSLLSFGLLPFIGFVTISLINFGFYSLRWQLIINEHLPQGHKLSLSRVFIDRMAGFSASYLTPAAQVGGEPVRIAMLSTGKKRVPLKQATSSVVLDIAFEMTAYIAFIGAGVLLALYQGLGDANSFLIIGIGLVAVLLFLVLFFVMVAFGKGFFKHLFGLTGLSRVKKFKRGIDGLIATEEMMTTFLRGRMSLVFVVAFLSLLVVSFRVAEVFYISHFFGVDLNFSHAFLMSTLPGVALLLPVPAGVGVFEGSFAAIFSLFAIGGLNAVSFALIIRARDIIFILTGLIHMLARGRAFIEEKILHTTQKS